MTDYKRVQKSTVDELAQFIRKVDGNHKMGAGALAEKICERSRVDTPAVYGEPVEGLRYTFDGALAECPYCGSLDVGGAHDTVHCQSCGLTVTKPGPLQNAIDTWNNNAIDAWNARARRAHSAAPAMQGEPVSAQVRYRRPEKGQPSWSVWQPAAVMLDRPSWEIDSQGWEVEYRLLYTAPQPLPDVAQLVKALMACAKASSSAEVGLIVDDALAAIAEGEGARGGGSNARA